MNPVDLRENMPLKIYSIVECAVGNKVSSVLSHPIKDQIAEMEYPIFDQLLCDSFVESSSSKVFDEEYLVPYQD